MGEMGAAGRTLLAFFIGAITACSSALTSSPPKSYVPWEPLPPAHHYVTTPLASPVSPPAVPEGAAVRRGAQLDGVALAEGAATGNVNTPLLFRNRSTTDSPPHKWGGVEEFYLTEGSHPARVFSYVAMSSSWRSTSAISSRPCSRHSRANGSISKR